MLPAGNGGALYPCHCTSLAVKHALLCAGFDVREVGVGFTAEL